MSRKTFVPCVVTFTVVAAAGIAASTKANAAAPAISDNFILAISPNNSLQLFDSRTNFPSAHHQDVTDTECKVQAER